MFLLSLATLLIPSIMYMSKPFSAHAGSGREIDLFCQKRPYGLGINNSGGTFLFEEQIILCALVTYNGYPIENKFVSFEVRGPINPCENVTFFRSAVTNSSGIAEISFKISLPKENLETLRTEMWSTIALVDIAEQRVVDVLTFRLYDRFVMLHQRYNIFL